MYFVNVWQCQQDSSFFSPSICYLPDIKALISYRVISTVDPNECSLPLNSQCHAHKERSSKYIQRDAVRHGVSQNTNQSTNYEERVGIVYAHIYMVKYIFVMIWRSCTCTLLSQHVYKENKPIKWCNISKSNVYYSDATKRLTFFE